MLNINPILNVDSYKSSMKNQYPPNVTKVFSYIESRGGKYDKTLFCGLQIFLKEYMSIRITKEMVDEAQAFFIVHGEPFPFEDWMYIVNELQGKLPIKIKAVSEGSIIPVHNVLVTIENTDPRCFWLTTWLETALLRAVWYPTTVATQSYEIRQTIMRYLRKTSDDANAEINFKLHDFGARGVSSSESAGIGGFAHLINFMGSDTIEGIRYANHYYNSPMAGFSIPAAEHSTITSWGKQQEVEAYRNMLNNFAKPGSLVAIVSDSYDLYNAVENLWGDALKQQIIDSGATVVIRPDSGNPSEVVLKTLELLEKKFGGTINSKGYIVLNNVRVIQGDGINGESIKDILDAVTNAGFSATNVAFGMGGALLQGINRDTQKFAMKCSYVEITNPDGTVEGRDVFKDPVTDAGKRSKAGKLTLTLDANNEVKTSLLDTFNENKAPGVWELLHTVYQDGEICFEQSLEDVRSFARTCEWMPYEIVKESLDTET